MRRRSFVFAVASGVLAIVLLIALVKFSQVDVRRLLGLLAAARPLPIAALLLLTGLHIMLAAEKWRLVEQRVAPGSELPRRLCFSLTAIGAAAGQIMPMQVATALTRSLGAHLATGSGAVRSALATLFEQMFDIVVVCLCGLLSAYCLWRGDIGWWVMGAVAKFATGFVLVPPTFAIMAAVTERRARAPAVLGARLGGLGRALARFRIDFETRLDAASVRAFRFSVHHALADDHRDHACGGPEHIERADCGCAAVCRASNGARRNARRCRRQ